jgi:hypothetical protein
VEEEEDDETKAAMAREERSCLIIAGIPHTHTNVLSLDRQDGKLLRCDGVRVLKQGI